MHPVPSGLKSISGRCYVAIGAPHLNTMCVSRRYAVIARRDLSLFYLQYVVVFMYGLMVGLLYMDLDYVVNDGKSRAKSIMGS